MGNKSSSIFRDARLELVSPKLITSMMIRYSVILRQLGKDRGEIVQFGRFINNAKVTPKRIIDYHWSQSTFDFSGKHVLVVSDTSTFSFSPRAGRKGLGYVGPKTDKEGFDEHPAILLDAANGACYGLGGTYMYRTEKIQTQAQKARRDKEKQERRNIALEDKERYKWFDAPAQAVKNCPGAACYTLVGDRESDIYDLINRTLENGWEFVYRSRVDRLLAENEVARKLHQAIQSWQVEHTYELELGQTKKRSKHTATLDLKFGQLSIKRPKDHWDKTLPEKIPLNIVELKERPNSVIGEEKPVHWTLLTSHPLQNLDQALQIVQWYRWRWTIEELFRTTKKKGLNVEISEVESYEALANIATLALIAACQIIQLVQARDGKTDQLLEQAFLEQEQECLRALNKKVQGKTLKSKNPHPPNSLAFGSWIIARLGGWSGYKSERPPGPITMTHGLIRFYAVFEGYRLNL